MKSGHIIVLAILSSYAASAFMTAGFLTSGAGYETNPVMAALVDEAGLVPALLFSFSVALCICYGLVKLGKSANNVVTPFALLLLIMFATGAVNDALVLLNLGDLGGAYIVYLFTFLLSPFLIFLALTGRMKALVF
jgi:hypothetical protein